MRKTDAHGPSEAPGPAGVHTPPRRGRSPSDARKPIERHEDGISYGEPEPIGRAARWQAGDRSASRPPARRW